MDDYAEYDVFTVDLPETEEDYKKPNIHDLDPYSTLIRNLGKLEHKKVKIPDRKLPDSINIKNPEVIEFTLHDVDPYCVGEKLYKSPIIRLKYGLNVLVGRNGSGKSTILRMLREDLSSNNYEFYNFDNLHDGGSNSISKAGFYNDFAHMSRMLMSSEGEGIMTNFTKVASAIGRFVRDSKAKYPNDPVFIIMDAIDSGLSVNNIIRIKDLFNIIKKDCKDAVIITSCNTFELARDSYCWDVMNSKPIEFKTYAKYHKFICDQDEDIINGEFKG
jgi:GTPase SAR1 family protein